MRLTTQDAGRDRNPRVYQLVKKRGLRSYHWCWARICTAQDLSDSTRKGDRWIWNGPCAQGNLARCCRAITLPRANNRRRLMVRRQGRGELPRWRRTWFFATDHRIFFKRFTRIGFVPGTLGNVHAAPSNGPPPSYGAQGPVCGQDFRPVQADDWGMNSAEAVADCGFARIGVAKAAHSGAKAPTSALCRLQKCHPCSWGQTRFED